MSHSANRDITAVIQAFQPLVSVATTNAADGHVKSQKMQEIASQASGVIDGRRQISLRSHDQAGEISGAAHKVRQLADLIKAATDQQSVASEQVASVVSGLSRTASEQAEASAFLAASVGNLEQISRNLQLSLAH